MKVLTGKQMAEVDRRAIEDYNINGLILMENAGLAVFEKILEIIEFWNEEQEEPFKSVVIVSGKGNNGGDGFVLARHLALNDIPVTVFATAEKNDYKGDALSNYLALENFTDINIITNDTVEDLRDSILEASIVVDALLGTGLKGNVEGIYADIIDIINESDGIIVSVDVPSGVVADSGFVGEYAVEADYTVTFAAPKLGLLIYPGADNVGELDIASIGMPDFLLENFESKIHLTTEHKAFQLLPWRPSDSHKGTFGKVLTVAGSANMTGAALLAANSVLKMGAGLSTLASPESLIPAYCGVYPELTYLPLKEKPAKTITEASITDIISVIDDYSALILGPGIGTAQQTIAFVERFIKHLNDKELFAVIDADALNCMAHNKNIELNSQCVITPHPKELARLLDVTVEEILNDRLKYVEMAANQYKCIVVLKGSSTLIASAEQIYINPTGSSALATGGTGDVLTGMIAGLIAQGLDAFNAAVCGVYLHGLAGDIAAENITAYSVTATDVMKHISSAIKDING